MLTVSYITNRIFNSRTYILSDPNSNIVWLVDCGDVDRIVESIGEKQVAGVLLTHVHFDHIYGLKELMAKYPKVLVYTNGFGAEALKSPKQNLSHYHSDYNDVSIDAPENIFILKEGDSFELFGYTVQIYETPGHSPSCLTFIVAGLAFTGDAYIPGVKVFTGFPHSNRKQAASSLDKILRLTSNCSIMPGHSVQ